ncbi:hypothetical protein [Corynebacterium terpenotabidum]|uniref:Uncharacterized protein n=1 Tax=Corynebacterium terpenotabidum Y-11 TaxID=1200352 RepID=S4XIB3_9CORY|nr:hypothetical protein [Corynebacterium terpenotabidum]AGP31430.1 hypothetical protein A606_08945 [Corynebacterium terpenotabidum Y-11]
MTGITAETSALTAAARRAAATADRLTAGTDPGGGPPVFALPQAARFLAALTDARARQATAATDFARFYSDAGAALTDLGGALTAQEGTTVERLQALGGGL